MLSENIIIACHVEGNFSSIASKYGLSASSIQCIWGSKKGAMETMIRGFIVIVILAFLFMVFSCHGYYVSQLEETSNLTNQTK